MKDKNFVIKVGDLLREGWKADTLSFSNKESKYLEKCSKDGISGEILIRSIDQDSLYVNVEHISCVFDETCDRCGASYKRPVETHWYTARFVASEQIKKEEQETTDEEIFLINTRDETIDLELLIIQAIKIDDPFISHCPDCKKEIESLPDDDEDDSLISWGNIVFH